MWRIRVLLLALALSACTAASMPMLRGTRTPSGYLFSFQLSDTAIWQEPSNPNGSEPFPTSALLLVRVQDAHGQPLDGVPVQFTVDPAWTRATTISPAQTTTQGGKARATFQAYDTGVVRVRVRIDGTTKERTIAVYPPYSIGETGGDGN